MTIEELIDLVKPENPYIFGYTPKENPYITTGNVTYIGLTQNKYTLIDTEDLMKIGNYHLCSAKSSTKGKFYAVTSKPVFLHRILYPEYKILDHINRNGLDNRKENLRNASPTLNNLNIDSKAASGYLGVHKDHSCWAVKIQVRGKEAYFGRFKTPEEANVVAKRERERIIKELEQELAQNPSSCPPQSPCANI